MLERIDIDRIRRVLRARGYDAWEIYAESRATTRMTAEDRFIVSRSATTCGMSLRLTGPGGTRQYSTSRMDTEGLLAALSVDEELGSSPAETPAPAALADIEKHGERLNALVRSTWPDSEGVRLGQLRFDAEIRDFETIGPEGTISRGREEWAGATAEWTVEREHKPVGAREELWAGSFDRFLEAWETRNPFRACTDRILRQTNPWPAPQGDIPVYWSSASVARLSQLFLRALDGDLVLDQLSFLTDVELPLPLPFSIFETGAEGVDHEGTPRKALAIWREGQPRALACHRSAAEKMSVPSTGHCRRQSYAHSPQVGVWHAVVQGEKVVTSPLSQLTWGIGISDFAVESFDPSTGDVVLSLTDARLIHQGELGEAIEALRWPTNLLTLMGSFTNLCDQTETYGFPILKKGSRWVTEISAPSAFSASVPLPGSVPPAHYWGD